MKKNILIVSIIVGIVIAIILVINIIPKNVKEEVINIKENEVLEDKSKEKNDALNANTDLDKNNQSEQENVIEENISGNKTNNIEIVSEIEYIQGLEVAGYIKISKFNVNAPIFKNVSQKSLGISVGIAFGNLNEEGNTTIFGHAYKDYPFEKLSQLENGDIISVIDANKKEITYEVYDKQTISNNDATYMIRNTNGAKEVTMQTGASDTTRLIVLAREIVQ